MSSTTESTDATPSVYVGMNQPAPRDTDYPGVLEIHVDASDVARRIINVHEVLPVEPGSRVQLLYPEWIPGHHRPSGPVRQLAGLVISDDKGRVLPWRRDSYNVYAFHVDVPADADTLDIRFQYLGAQNTRQGPIRMTPEALDLSWEKVSLYPAGYHAARITTRPSLTVPAGWQVGTVLNTVKTGGDTHQFETIDYLNLVDSPVYAGKHFKRLAIGTEQSPPVHISLIADAEHHLAVKPEQIKLLNNIVEQMGKLYGAYHFDRYEFLLSLSDKLGHKGLEHSRSSENGEVANYFTKWKKTRRNDLLTHEFNHSWNGKYRRAAGHATPNFNVPMEDSLMWVYEGQTQFYGNVVAVRAGLEDLKTGLTKLADVAANYDVNRPGFRSWRTIQDTTNDPTIAQRAPRPYRNWQGSEDYYAGGQLIWLAVDGKMRQLSDNRHCLDDFARAFFGVNPGAWDILTYVEDDIYRALDAIVPHDWKTFIRERLDGHGNLADGLALQGWQLVYTPQPDAGHRAMTKALDGNFIHSAGFASTKDGKLADVRWDGPAFRAGLTASMQIIAVDGIQFSPDAMKRAIEHAQHNDAPIRLLVRDFDRYQTLDVDYHDGMKFPSLKRIDGTPDYLSELYAPR